MNKIFNKPQINTKPPKSLLFLRAFFLYKKTWNPRFPVIPGFTAPCRIRTGDLRITNASLYQLSQGSLGQSKVDFATTFILHDSHRFVNSFLTFRDVLHKMEYTRDKEEGYGTRIGAARGGVLVPQPGR